MPSVGSLSTCAYVDSLIGTGSRRLSRQLTHCFYVEYRMVRVAVVITAPQYTTSGVLKDIVYTSETK